MAALFKNATPRRYLLNAPVLPQDGLYSLVTVDVDRAIRWASCGGFTNAVAHAGAARWASDNLGLKLPIARTAISMRAGDEALVCCLRGRLSEPRELTADEMGRIGCVFKLLVRLA